MPDNNNIRDFYIEKRKDNRRRVAVTAAISLSLSLLVAICAIAGYMIACNSGCTPPPDGETTSIVTDAPETTDTAQTTAESETDTITIPETGAETDTTPETTGESTQDEPVEYDFTKPVPESAPVDKSYYDDALFIGDSRTEGFRMFAGLNNATYYSAKGLAANTVFTEHFISPDGFNVPPGVKTGKGGTLTVAQAIEYGRGFGKIYIMLGINELGWQNVNTFIDFYRELVAHIRKYNPDAVIYVQLIIPVSKTKSDSDKIYNNERIEMFNSLIAQMCADERVYCINTLEAVCDENGALPEDAGVDGVHMKRSYCERWRDYLFCHTVGN
jgi:hypothetical protein